MPFEQARLELDISEMSEYETGLIKQQSLPLVLLRVHILKRTIIILLCV
jgi:hypothetical protein